MVKFPGHRAPHLDAEHPTTRSLHVRNHAEPKIGWRLLRLPPGGYLLTSLAAAAGPGCRSR